MNAVTSLFVEATMFRAAQDNILATQVEFEKKEQHIADLREFFLELDSDGDGMICYNEFATGVFHPRLQAFAASLGMDVYDTLVFFKTLSGNLNRSVDLETFVMGCIKLRGEAKA